MSSSPIKTEFTEVLTGSDLLPLRNLCQQAAQLLDEADALSRQHYAKRRELEEFTSNLKQASFR